MPHLYDVRVILGKDPGTVYSMRIPVRDISLFLSFAQFRPDNMHLQPIEEPLRAVDMPKNKQKCTSRLFLSNEEATEVWIRDTKGSRDTLLESHL